MIDISTLKTKETGTSYFTDSRAVIHTVHHKVTITDKYEAEENVSEELFRVFENVRDKSSVRG